MLLKFVDRHFGCPIADRHSDIYVAGADVFDVAEILGKLLIDPTDP